MKTEFRNRAFLPVVMPLAILAVVGAVVGLVALVLLYVDRQGAVAIAFLAAAGVLLAISLAASRDQLDLPRRGAVALAAVAPLVAGGLVAAGVVGGLADDERNINVEPHQPQWIFEGLLEGAPVLAADSALGFCLPEQCDGESITREWAFSYAPEEIKYAFDNRDSGVQHNLQIFNVPADQLDAIDGPIGLTELQENYPLITPGEPPTFDGPDEQTYLWVPPVQQETGEATAIPGQAYFVCTIHAGSMWGVVEISPE